MLKSCSWLEIRARYGPETEACLSPMWRPMGEGQITSFPRTLGTICIRRDRDGTIWSAGGVDARLYCSSDSGWSPMPYPEKEVGPVISLAVDRNHDLWISTATGGVFHFAKGTW